MNSGQIQGLRQQFTGLLLQRFGKFFGNEKCVARGKELRLQGYIKARYRQGK